MMTWIWLGLLAAFIVIELATAQLVTVWFAVGSFAAFLASFFTESVFIQIGIFAVVSAIALAVTRPLVKKLTKVQKQPTNADMYIGSECVVTETIDNLAGKGLVKVKGSVWTARTDDESITVNEGELVVVDRIEGVKLIVTPKK